MVPRRGIVVYQIVEQSSEIRCAPSRYRIPAFGRIIRAYFTVQSVVVPHVHLMENRCIGWTCPYISQCRVEVSQQLLAGVLQTLIDQCHQPVPRRGSKACAEALSPRAINEGRGASTRVLARSGTPRIPLGLLSQPP